MAARSTAARSTAARSVATLLTGGLVGAGLLGLASCGPDRTSSVPVGGGPVAPLATTPSNAGVVFVPLDSPSGSSSTAPSPGSTAATTPGSGSTPGTTPAATTGGTGAGGNSGSGSHPGTGGHTTGSTGGTGSGTTGGSTGGTTGGGTTAPPTQPSSPPPSSGTPQSPASLTITALSTAGTAQRWCQQVTLTLANSGDRTATSAGVTFSTHVIGALGVDWWTYQTTQPLVSPVAGHAGATEQWTVCLDSWRVPDGMHLETRAATVS